MAEVNQTSGGGRVGAVAKGDDIPGQEYSILLNSATSTTWYTVGRFCHVNISRSQIGWLVIRASYDESTLENLFRGTVKHYTFYGHFS